MCVCESPVLWFAAVAADLHACICCLLLERNFAQATGALLCAGPALCTLVFAWHHLHVSCCLWGWFCVCSGQAAVPSTHKRCGRKLNHACNTNPPPTLCTYHCECVCPMRSAGGCVHVVYALLWQHACRARCLDAGCCTVAVHLPYGGVGVWVPGTFVPLHEQPCMAAAQHFKRPQLTQLTNIKSAHWLAVLLVGSAAAYTRGMGVLVACGLVSWGDLRKTSCCCTCGTSAPCAHDHSGCCIGRR